MRDQPADEQNGPRRGVAAQIVAHVLEPADQQILLVGEVNVERRAPDLRAIADRLDAHPIPAALEDQRDQRPM